MSSGLSTTLLFLTDSFEYQTAHHRQPEDRNMQGKKNFPWRSTAPVTYVLPPTLKAREVKSKRLLMFLSCLAERQTWCLCEGRRGIFFLKKKYFTLFVEPPGLFPSCPTSPPFAEFSLSAANSSKGKAGVYCVCQQRSFTTLLALQQQALQQSLMCRLLPHIQSLSRFI